MFWFFLFLSQSVWASAEKPLCFYGQLPCADCVGIETELRLFPRSVRYEWRSVFLGKSQEPILEEGPYNVIPGTKKQAAIYEFAYDTKNPRYLLAEPKRGALRRLRLLDRHKEKIPKTEKQVLHKKKCKDFP